MPDQTKVDTGTETINEVLEGLQQDLIVPIGRAYNLLESLAAERDDLQAQLAEARAVVERLPKTADGACVTELDGPVFAVREYRVLATCQYVSEVVECVVVFDTQQTVPWQGWWLADFGSQAWFPLMGCYSTREAAEAARGEKGGGA
jgi:hypothetical protein